MSYIKTFREDLYAKLGGLPDEARKEAVDFATKSVLESYHNGVADGASGKKKPKANEEPAKAGA